MKLFDLPHHDAEALAKSGAPVYLTVNPVEYHGPHLSLHNDRLVSEGLVRDLHARLADRHPEWPLLLAEDVEVGVGPTPGTGTRVLSYSMVNRLLAAATDALLELGARRVVFVTFHGDPLHNQAIENAVRRVQASGGYAFAPFHILMDDLLHVTERFKLEEPPLDRAFAHIEDPTEKEALLAEFGVDFHAGFLETSVALHYAPESVSPAFKRLPPCPRFPKHQGWALGAAVARGVAALPGAEQVGLREPAAALAAELRFVSEIFGWQELAPFPGYTGRPHLASAVTGEIFAHHMVERFAEEAELVLTGRKRPAGPPLAWAMPLSLGGRVGQLPPAPRGGTARLFDGVEAVTAKLAAAPTGRKPRRGRRSAEVRRVLSISLGAKSRDHTVRTDFAGVPFELSRVGTDGDFGEALRLFRDHDGKVDAFGLGGAVLFLELGDRRYYFRDCKRIRRAVKHTKLADGNGIKHLLEARAVELLSARLGTLRGKRAFVMSGADRYGQAKALFDAGCRAVAGDLIFTMGLDVPIRSLRGVEALGAVILPPALLAPFSLYYPTGEEQERPPVRHPRFTRYYEDAEIIAGDYLWLRKYMPDDMSGKIVLTNTTTPQNVEELQRRGVKLLVTSTPRLDGRSFGTNVLEAMTLCLIDKPQPAVTRDDYAAAIGRAKLAPQLEVLNEVDPKLWNLLPPAIVAAGTTVCLIGETAFPAVRRDRDRWPHARRNFVFWAGQIGLNVAAGGILVAISQWCQAHGWGLLNWISLPPLAAAVAGVLLIDVTTYWRHRASHRVPWLWRLHTLHHNDPELDVTTSLRTHPVEALLLVVFSGAQIAFVGAPIGTLLLQSPLILGVSFFHHANWRIPSALDRLLRVVIVTPDMHKIHHAREPSRTDSNFCILFSVWDRLFGTWVAPDRARDTQFGLDPPAPAAEATLAGMWQTGFRGSDSRPRSENLFPIAERD